MTVVCSAAIVHTHATRVRAKAHPHFGSADAWARDTAHQQQQAGHGLAGTQSMVRPVWTRLTVLPGVTLLHPFFLHLPPSRTHLRGFFIVLFCFQYAQHAPISPCYPLYFWSTCWFSPISPFFSAFFSIFPQFFFAKFILFECIIVLLSAPNWPKIPTQHLVLHPTVDQHSTSFRISFFSFVFRFLHFFFSTSIFILVFISFMRTRNWAKDPIIPFFSNRDRIDARWSADFSKKRGLLTSWVELRVARGGKGL